MTTPPLGSQSEATRALADRLEDDVEQLASTNMQLGMRDWNRISSDILEAARTLRAALTQEGGE